MTDWRSYDRIARRYDDVWGSRFEAVARQIWARIALAPGALVLDVGTGTGIVPRALGAAVGRLAGVVGCDRAAAMLSLARATLPALRVLAADATALPFRDSIFDVVTASFVLSHLRSHRAGLAEACRVLRTSGVFAMASWTASTDPYSQAWTELLAEAVSKERLQEAVAQVAPSEGYFESPENVRTVLTEAGLAGVEVHSIALDCSTSLELYVADRELSSGGRFARDALDPAEWDRFAAHARETLRGAFGSHVSYTRGALIGLGRRA